MMLAAEWEALVFEHRRESFPILSLSLLEPLTRRVLVQSIPLPIIIAVLEVLFLHHYTPTRSPVFLSTILINSNQSSPSRRFLQTGATQRPTHAGTLGTLTSASR